MERKLKKGDPNTLSERIDRHGEDDMPDADWEEWEEYPQTLNLFYLPMFDSNSYKKELLP